MERPLEATDGTTPPPCVPARAGAAISAGARRNWLGWLLTGVILSCRIAHRLATATQPEIVMCVDLAAGIAHRGRGSRVPTFPPLRPPFILLPLPRRPMKRPMHFSASPASNFGTAVAPSAEKPQIPGIRP
jgi:hypothetical protein